MAGVTAQGRAWADSVALHKVARAAGVTDYQARKVLAELAELRAEQVCRMVTEAHRIETSS